MRNTRSKLSLTAATFVLASAVGTQEAAACSSESYLGEICQVGFTFCPRGYAETDGQLLSIAQNQALFALLGTTYGGNGQTTFALPDLRGRSMVHIGTGPGLSPKAPGQAGGAETHTITVAEMPSHSHVATTTATATLRGSSAAGDSESPGGNVPAQGLRVFNAGPANVDMGPSAIDTTASTTIANTGGSQSFGIRDPYLGIRHCIALIGIFPPRD